MRIEVRGTSEETFGYLQGGPNLPDFIYFGLGLLAMGSFLVKVPGVLAAGRDMVALQNGPG